MENPQFLWLVIMTDNAIVQSEDKSIVPMLNLSGEETWQELVNQLVSELPEELPDKVIKATELLLVGHPINDVAKQVGVQPSTIRSWIQTYPTLALILSNGKKLLSKWRMSKMEQQFLLAVNKSKQILETSLDGGGTSSKHLAAIAAQSRYVIGLFIGQKQDISVTHELGESVLNAEKNALNYLAQRLAEQQAHSTEEPIEAVFRVIDDKVDNNGPMLDAYGNPPHGELGELDKTDEGSQCHICGKRYKSLAKHLLATHNMDTANYELLYMLPEGSVRDADGYWK